MLNYNQTPKFDIQNVKVTEFEIPISMGCQMTIHFYHLKINGNWKVRIQGIES